MQENVFVMNLWSPQNGSAHSHHILGVTEFGVTCCYSQAVPLEQEPAVTRRGGVRRWSAHLFYVYLQYSSCGLFADKLNPDW